jgi:anti-sigma B factor antagonist
MDDSPQLSIAISPGPDRARIFLHGELDLNTVETFRARFDEMLATNGNGRRSFIVLDLGEVTFCDSTGLHTLLDLATRCHQLGVTLRLANLAAAVQRVMELTDTVGRFNVEVDVRPQDTQEPGRLSARGK